MADSEENPPLPTLKEGNSLSRPRGGTAHRRKGTSELAQSYIENVTSNTKCCGDCDAQETHWASVIKSGGGLIGGIVLLCNRCAGVHRSLGTHICEVRSLSLDTWSDELAEQLKQQGTSNLNEDFEYHVPPEFRKPNADSMPVVLERYIRAKYDECLFHWDNCQELDPKSPALDEFGGHSANLDNDKMSVGQQEYHGILNILLKSAAFLPKADLFSESDPYVIMKHGMSQSCKSKIIRNCCNPVWDEQLSLSVHEDKPIQLEVYDWDVRNDDLIGIIKDWRWVDDIKPDQNNKITLDVDCSVYKKNRKKQATITMEIYYTKLA